jgi:hypothetical protein
MRTCHKVEFVLGLGLLFVLMVSAPVMASDTFPDDFNLVYPASQSANNAGCQLCHTTSTSQFNQFGRDLAVQLRSPNNLAFADALHAIEGTQSDKDPAGATNIAEINASAQPGWTPGAVNNTYSRSNLAALVTNAVPPAAITGNIDPPAAPIGAKVGVYRSSNNTFYLDANGSGGWNGCATDTCAPFGIAGDIPLLGDWNGNGTTKVGTFRPSAGTFYLDYNGNNNWEGCATDRCFQVGLNGDIPVVGDWNGNGTTKVGTFRPSDGTFYLDYNGNGVWEGCATDRCLQIGLNGDLPVVGDWNGSGTAKVGLFRPSNGTFYLDYNGNGVSDGCGVDQCLTIGLNGDIPVVGDWNSSGTTKVGTFRPSDGAFYLDYNGNGVWDGCGVDRCLPIGMNGDVPFVGDWNGSGTAKVGTYRPSDGYFYLDYNGNGAWDGCAVDRCIAFGIAGDTPLVAQQ